jgi:hypothetical protein
MLAVSLRRSGLRGEGGGGQAATPVAPYRCRRGLGQHPAHDRSAPFVITVVDPDAARTALLAGRLSCPQPGCGGALRAWSRARARRVRLLGGGVEEVRPDRGRCRSCGVTHVLLPARCLPRRSYGVQVIGAALLAAAQGAGCARAAACVDVPAATVRGWLRAVTRAAPTLTAQAITILRASGMDLPPDPPLGSPAPSPLARVIDALGAAARAFRLVLATPRPPGPGGVLTGIDYLALLAERHRRQVHAQLGLDDPTGAAAHCPPWQLVTVITGGRLLTTRPG